jgi:hypothetical protein
MGHALKIAIDQRVEFVERAVVAGARRDEEARDVVRTHSGEGTPVGRP